MNSETSFLIVEDEVLTALLYQRALKKHGFLNIEKVTSGEAAVSMYERFISDIVLMDITLAGEMNGIEAARRILKIGRPRIVILTGYQDHTLREEAEALSLSGFFVKPIDIPAVLASLG